MPHQSPTKKRTRQREKVVLFINIRITIDTHCKRSPALYPIPSPVPEIRVDICSSVEVRLFEYVFGGVKRAAVESTKVASESVWCPEYCEGATEEPAEFDLLGRCCTFGWCLTRRGRKEFRRTNDAPKQVFAIIARRAPSR